MTNDFFNNFTKNHILFNMAIWVMLAILLAFPFGFPNSFATLFPVIPSVYIHFFLVKKYFKKKHYISYVLFTLTTVLFFGMIADEIYSVNSTIVYIIEQIIPIGQPIFHSPDFMPVFNPFVGVVIASILSYLNNKQHSEIQEIKAQKTKAELEYLKSQINPHFFFNTLNTLYSMVMVKGDEETAEGISQLSGLMRYMIYDTKVDLISLDKEIEHIRDFIELQKLRFSEEDGLEVKLEIFGKTKPKTIPPMLFIPFIENAYKHGFSIKQKSKIFIQIDVLEGRLKFRVMNSINNKKLSSPEHSGIGIENVKKRLEILFPKNHELKISQVKGYFNVFLSFPI